MILAVTVKLFESAVQIHEFNIMLHLHTYEILSYTDYQRIAGIHVAKVFDPLQLSGKTGSRAKVKKNKQRAM